MYAIPMLPGEGIEKIFTKYGEFPLYGFFLYSTLDKDIIEFISGTKNADGTEAVKGNITFLNQVSGESCLLALFENPENWGVRWKEYWHQKLTGTDGKFDEQYEIWKHILPEDRDLSYSLADLLSIDITTIPCIVFVKSPDDNVVLTVPIITNKEKYRDFFEDLFKVTRKVSTIPEEQRFAEFQKNWKIFWLKWILPEKVRGYNSTLKEWGSIITETKTTIMGIVDPLTPLVTSIKAAVAR